MPSIPASNFIPKSAINAANGVAGLDANGKLPVSELTIRNIDSAPTTVLATNEIAARADTLRLGDGATAGGIVVGPFDGHFNTIYDNSGTYETVEGALPNVAGHLAIGWTWDFVANPQKALVWAIGNSIGSDSPACFWDPATNTYSFEDQGHTGISIQAANVLVGVNGYVELNGSDLGDSYILRLKPADNLLGAPSTASPSRTTRAIPRAYAQKSLT